MRRFPRWLNGVLVGLIVLGVVFRFVNLNHKVYWHDEVYTTMRAAGYTRSEIDAELFQNRQWQAGELQRYQQIKPNSTVLDTVRSLALEDPQHPPLYFVLTRSWMQALDWPLSNLFRSSLTTQRSLPALLGVAALPAMYGLAWELFGLPSVALLATTLLALSPFDVLFAQTARQYSFLTLMVIVSSYCLVRAMRVLQAQGRSRPSPVRSQSLWAAWGSYGLSVAIGLYVQPFFGLTVLGHIAYVGGLWYFTARLRRSPLWRWLGGSVAGALVLYSPWMAVMILNRDRALATTNWLQDPVGLGYLLKFWLLSFTALFFDLDFGYTNPWTWIARLPFLVLIGASVYVLCLRTPPKTWLLLVTAIAVPFLILALPDLLFGSKRSTISRYLISCYPAIQLAVAYFLALQFSAKPLYSGRSPKPLPSYSPRTLLPETFTRLKPWLWRSLFALLVVGSLTSLTVSALSNSWWNRDLSYFNDQTADLLNAQSNVVLVSDLGPEQTNTGDLISLSYRLRPTTELLLLKDANFVDTMSFQSALQGKTAIAFRPTLALQQRLEAMNGPLSKLLEGERLYAISLP